MLSRTLSFILNDHNDLNSSKNAQAKVDKP